MTINLFAYSFIFGYNCALDTLISQAVGSGNLELCTVYLNRGRIILTIIYLMIIAIMCNAEKMLVALHQDPEVAHYVQ